MPHINIAYFHRPLSNALRAELDSKLTRVICDCLEVPQDAVSIALEPVDPDHWNEQVAAPRIVARKAALLRAPNYPLPDLPPKETFAKKDV